MVYYILGILAIPIGAVCYFVIIGILKFLFGGETMENLMDF